MKKIVYILFVIGFTCSGLIAKDFKIGVDNWEPFIIVNDEKITGISIDYIKELTDKMGVNLVIRRIPWARSLKMLKSGQLDAVINMVKTKERSKYIVFTDPPYFKLTTRFYIKKGKNVKIEKYEDLYNYFIGAVKNSAYFERFDKDTKLKKFEGVLESQILAMLVKDRFKVIVGTEPQVDFEASKKGFNQFIEKAPYKPGNEVLIRVGISKKSPFAKEIDNINKYAKEILESKIIDKFRDKYIHNMSF